MVSPIIKGNSFVGELGKAMKAEEFALAEKGVGANSPYAQNPLNERNGLISSLENRGVDSRSKETDNVPRSSDGGFMPRSSRLRATAELSKSLHEQLNKYALAAGAAGVGMLALTQPAEGKIVCTPAHVVISKPFPLDLNHDGIVDFYILNASTALRSGIEHRLLACQTVTSTSIFCRHGSGANAVRSIGGDFAAALHPGAKIKPGDRFFYEVELGVVRTARSGPFWYGPWVKGGKGVRNRYLGLKFKIAGRFHFGWARLTVTTTSHAFTALLTGYAYETIPGKGIVAGVTKGPNDELTTSFNTHAPQPATLGMLALGAPGLSIWKREEESSGRYTRT